VVTPAWNEADSLPELYNRIKAVMESEGRDFELLVVENGSTDGSLSLLKDLHRKDPRVHYLSLSRNFGHQGALTAGLEHARGEALIFMDADLQHPPEVIPRLLEEWDRGADVVFTLKRETAQQGVFRKVADSFFYTLLRILSGLNLSSGQSDFRLVDRRAAEALMKMTERNKFLRGMTRWIGFRQVTIAYDVAPRFAGESKFRFFHLFRFALDGIFSFSILPLRLFTYFGLVVSTLSFLYVFYVGLVWLGWAPSVWAGQMSPGWTSLAAGVFLLGGVQMLGIGVLGEYLSRVYDETRSRPVYLIRETSLREPEGQAGSD